MMIATIPETSNERAGSRTRKVRPSYLGAGVLEAAAEKGEARLLARVRKQRGE
jgi:hypothetical protein